MPIITLTPNEAVYGRWKRIIHIGEKAYIISKEFPIESNILIYRNHSSTFEVRIQIEIDWEHHPLFIKIPFWKKKVVFNFRDKSFTLKVLRNMLGKVLRINSMYVIFDKKWVKR